MTRNRQSMEPAEEPSKSFSTGTDSRPAHLYVDAAGSITTMSLSARRMLGYEPESAFEPCFFAHIHGRNLLQVMRDVASMICQGKASARWMVRMKTATSDWIWMRLTAHHECAATPQEGIAVYLERVDA